MKKSTTLTFSLAFTGMLMTSCLNNSYDDATGSPTDSTWNGKPIDSIQYAVQLLMQDGKLIVANHSKTKPGIALIDTTTGKISAYYPELLPPSAMTLTTDNRLIISETDYTQGAISVLHLSAGLIQKSVLTFGSDNAVTAADDKVFLLDHKTGVVTGFTGHAPNQGVVFNVQTGAVSNPYDIAISNNRAFIPRYDSKSLLVLDATKLDGGVRDSIDLSQYVSHHPVDTSAGAPRMAWITAYNGYVFVALQRLNYQYSALDTAMVVVINAATKQITSTIPLHFKNPVAAHAVGNTWYLTSIAGYGDQTGGVEKIDLSLRVHGGNVITEQTLAADVFDFIPAGVHSGYVAYSTDYGYTTHVKKVSY